MKKSREAKEEDCKDPKEETYASYKRKRDEGEIDKKNNMVWHKFPAELHKHGMILKLPRVRLPMAHARQTPTRLSSFPKRVDAGVTPMPFLPSNREQLCEYAPHAASMIPCELMAVHRLS